MGPVYFNYQLLKCLFTLSAGKNNFLGREQKLPPEETQKW